MTDPALIRDRLGTLFGPGVAVAALAVDNTHPLFPEEETAMVRALPARRAEFASGRAAARAAMAGFGSAAVAIPMGGDRAPVWPPGLTGSISHGGGIAVAAVAPVGDIRALGVDIEPDERLAQDLWNTLLNPGEQARARAAEDPGRWAMAVFAAKECTYKAQYPLTRRNLEFSDLSVSFSAESGKFFAVFQQSSPPFDQGMQVSGRLVRAGGLIVAAMVM